MSKESLGHHLWVWEKLAATVELSRLYALPRGLLLFVGVVNLLYASYSFSLVVRASRPMSFIKLLLFANLAWGVVCLGLAVSFWNRPVCSGSDT